MRGRSRFLRIAAGLAVASILVAMGDSSAADDQLPAPKAGELDVSVPGVDPATQQRYEQVDEFVEGLLARHGDRLRASVDWEREQVLLAVKPPIPSDLAVLEGTRTSGLTVRVTAARFDDARLRSLLQEITDANLPEGRRVLGFEVSTDGGSLGVVIRELSRLSADDRAGLQRDLTAIVGEEVSLVEAPVTVLDTSSR